MNVAFPKLEFENEAVPVKQSLSVFLTMVVQGIFGFLLIGISVLFGIFGFSIIGSILTLGITLALTLLCHFILIGPSARKYARIIAP